MVDLMSLLSDALIGSFQMFMLNDFGKNMFPYRIKTCWKRILIYGVTALVILSVNHIESTFINIMMIPVSYTIASIVIFQGSVWKKIILACCYYMLAIVPEFLFAVITGAYGVTGTENNFHSELEKLLSLLLMSTITFLLVKCVNQITRKKNYQTIENKLFTVLLTLPAATIIIFMCIYYSQISYTGVAYIIFTSGSTGEPKGVTITHAAAVNTIEDINNKNKVTCDDSVLGLSKLNFDLSVYDIFGLLQVGGKIVYPIQENYMNPDHWIKMIEEHRITIWNSVPALMKILLTELETMNTTHMLPLRCVLLSGDWIPVNMPSQIKEIVPMAKINCLGGATEASIWSINHEFCDERIYEKIPYGKPLSNQAMDVCNEDGESCPVWVQVQLINVNS